MSGKLRGFIVLNIFNNITAYPKGDKNIVTIGAFDGVHSGHKIILDRITQSAREISGKSVVVTFEPHPRIVLQSDVDNLKFITTREEKIELFEKSGIDELIIIHFTKEFAGTNSEDFIENIILNKIGAVKIIIGFDHHFGKNSEGNFELLKKIQKKFDFELEKVEAHQIEGMPISSTKIRKEIEKGNVGLANQMLGYTFSITGNVVHGNKIGMELGFPTANILPYEIKKLIPAQGIYAARVKLHDNIFDGMVYIGERPTLNLNQPIIEVNIFDFNQEIYGKDLKLFFIEYVRDDERFSSIDELKGKIADDKTRIIEILKTK